MDLHEQIFVDGEWRKASGLKVHTLVNPATEESYGEVVEANSGDVDLAVSSAKNALYRGPWADASVEERCRAVQAIQEWLVENERRLATETSTSSGLPFSSVRGLLASIEVIDMYIDAIRSLRLEFVRSEPSGSTLITRRAVGVVAGITPWNTPVRAEVKKAIPALLAGCTVVLKPAPDTPFGGIALAEAAAATGLPPGVLNVVFGGPSTGAALVSHPGVDKIAFTGSTATGSKIAEICGESIKRMQLELGGKSAAIVLDDADIAEAVTVLDRGNYLSTGQMCTALSRILVPESRVSEVADALAERAQAHRIGDPLDEKTTLGPLVNRTQHERVLRYIGIAKDEGAKLVTGGRRPSDLPKGWYIEPTVFVDVANTMTVAREEVFGPVASIIAYRNEEEAIAVANDTPYGLSGAVLSSDEGHALEVARRIRTGTVGINRYGPAYNAPFGGVKRSGVGREHGPEGFDTFLEYQCYGIPESMAEELASRGLEREVLSVPEVPGRHAPWK